MLPKQQPAIEARDGRGVPVRANRVRPIALRGARASSPAVGGRTRREGADRAARGTRLRPRPRRARGVGVRMGPVRVPPERRTRPGVEGKGPTPARRQEAGRLRHALAPSPESHRDERGGHREGRRPRRPRQGARPARRDARPRSQTVRRVRRCLPESPRGVARSARPLAPVGGRSRAKASPCGARSRRPCRSGPSLVPTGASGGEAMASSLPSRSGGSTSRVDRAGRGQARTTKKTRMTRILRRVVSSWRGCAQAAGPLISPAGEPPSCIGSSSPSSGHRGQCLCEGPPVTRMPWSSAKGRSRQNAENPYFLAETMYLRAAFTVIA